MVEGNSVAGVMIQEFGEKTGKTVSTETMEMTDYCKVVLVSCKRIMRD